MMNRKTNIKNFFGTLLTLCLITIASMVFSTNALAAEAQGATVTENTSMEVLVPLKYSEYASLPIGTKVYIGRNNSIKEGDLPISASAYVEKVAAYDSRWWGQYSYNPTYYEEDSYYNNEGTSGYKATDKFFVHVLEKAPGFDGCKGGIIFTENQGETWMYSCNGGGVERLPIQPYIAKSVTSKVTVEMKDPEYILKADQEMNITANDIAKVNYEYTYGNEKREGTLDNYKVTKGKVSGGNSEITIGFGVGGSVTVSLPLTYETKFDLGDGTTESQYIKHGGYATKPQTIPTKEGFDFQYWSTTPGGEEFNFDTTPIKDVTRFYAVWAVGNKFISAEVDENSKGTISAAGINNDATELSNALLSEEEKALVSTGIDSNIFLTVEDIQDKLTEEQKAKVEEGLKNDSSIAVVLDLNLFKKIGNTEPVKIANTQGNMVSITLTLDDKYINNNPGLERTYEIIRVHETGEGTEISVLPAFFDPVTKTITFETDRFSLYAISLADKAVATETVPAPTTKSPKTGDGLNLPLIIMMMALSMLTITSAMFVRTKKCDK
ncbi:MAG: hypothetical protein E7241_01495 [Lachnospiraceae bacterium]|nr:hypothetical protein [Lachnospiraceae bacterium]